VRLPFNADDKTIPGIHVQSIEANNILYFSSPDDVLPYETGIIRIKYTGFYYARPEDIIYRYQLIGRDSSWNFTTARMLEFSSLDPGNYKLLVQAGAKDGVWGESTEVRFKISTPYWRTWWFITLAVIAVSGLLYLTIRWLLKRLRKGDIIEKKLVHLERSALLAQMNPHFIFNSLNSIQSYIANNENDKANRFLAKFSRLIRAMLNHSRSPKVSLQEEINSLELYLELEKMRFKGKFEFVINVDPDIDTHEIELPPLLIQPYLENAIIHGLAKKDGVGRIELFYMLMGKHLIATVTDNGIGIEQSKQLKENSSSLHKSVGMTITQKRLELLDENNKDKKVNIEEVKDRHGKVLGTKVEVKIRVID
jgi:two-component sensor histidine kinase